MSSPALPAFCLMCRKTELLPGSSFCKTCFPLMFPKTTTLLRDLDKINVAQVRQLRDGLVPRDAQIALNNLSAQQLGEQAKEGILAAEADYRKRLFYAEDKPGAKMGKANGFRNLFCMKFVPSAGETPATAITKFFQGETVCECHSLILAVYYRAILALVGDSCFNLLFPDLMVEYGTEFGWSRNPIKRVWTEFKVKQDESNILVGDWVYCVNRTDYKTKHPLGNAGGWNLICVSTGPRKYLGFGLAAIGPDIKRHDLSGPLTLEEVLKVLDLCYLMDPQKLSLETKRELASYDLPRPKGVTIEKACLDVSVPGKRLNAAHIKALFQEKMLNYTKGKIDDHLTLPSLEK